MTNKPFGSLSMDLDNQWSYMKTHGDTGWETFPSYFDKVIPRVLGILDQLNLKITFFIVGQDAALERNHDALRLITDRGHEVGNHSFNHDPCLHLYEKDRIKREILETEELIYRVTGHKPVGFRAPSFGWSCNLIEALAESGYLYDASSLPTYLGPLARAYYFWKSNLTDEEKAQRENLFGSLKEGLRSIKPYFWELFSGEKLLEIPVTTMPIIKVPFHMSYLLYLSRFSVLLMFMYLKTALILCRRTHTTLSFLLHPTDLLGCEKVPELAFFPGMDINTKRKTKLFNKVIDTLASYFSLVNMRTLVECLVNTNLRKNYCFRRVRNSL
jgi:hypothetical protein